VDLPISTLKPEQPDSPQVEPQQAFIEKVAAYRLLWSVGLAVFVFDQITKVWISANLQFPTYWPEQGAITVIENFFYLVHVGNTGAAWSLFAGQSSLLAVLAAATLVGIFFSRHHLRLRAPQTQLAFGLLCGGIVGNFADRLIHGHVIDFLDFRFGNYTYPTFNIADSGICVGVLLYLWQSFREPSE